MKEIAWEDIAPHLMHERQARQLGAARADLVAQMLRKQLDCEHIEVLLRGVSAPGWNNGSCTKFYIDLDENWSCSLENAPASKRYTIGVAISERGPFIVSSGSEWLLAREDWEAPGQEKLRSQRSTAAEKRAKEVALLVAKQFDLIYLDANWLRQFKLNERELTEEVLLSLDYSEPDALNVLFDETL